MDNNINPNISFTARPKINKILPKAQEKFKDIMLFCTGR